jgi:hypothetical protein
VPKIKPEVLTPEREAEIVSMILDPNRLSPMHSLAAGYKDRALLMAEVVRLRAELGRLSDAPFAVDVLAKCPICHRVKLRILDTETHAYSLEGYNLLSAPWEHRWMEPVGCRTGSRSPSTSARCRRSTPRFMAAICKRGTKAPTTLPRIVSAGRCDRIGP